MRMQALSVAILLALAGLPPAPAAQADTAGKFDHYVLALSWHPSWCAAEGDDRDAPECDAGARRGFSVHGLWPQHARGWPEFCRTTARDPTRRETAAMADLMGSGGLAWYQWRKHGRCTGLDGAAYLALVRQAAATIAVPPGFRRIGEPLQIDPDTVERAFLAANPGLDPEGVVVTCRDGMLHEVRVCLDRRLSPRPCSEPERGACRASRVALPPLR